MASKNPCKFHVSGHFRCDIFCVALYSEKLAALVKSNLLTLSIEQVNDDDRRKNTEILANQQLEGNYFKFKVYRRYVVKG